MQDAIIWNRSIQSRAAICLELPVATYQSPFERWLWGRGAAPVAFNIGGEFGVPHREDVSRRGRRPSGSGVAAVCSGVPNTAEQHVGPQSEPINTHNNPTDKTTDLRIRRRSPDKTLYTHKKKTKEVPNSAQSTFICHTASGRQLSLSAHAQTLFFSYCRPPSTVHSMWKTSNLDGYPIEWAWWKVS
jgi:hypothetical protein